MKDLKGRLCQIVDELVDGGVPLAQARRQFERMFIVAALRRHNGNVTRSAETLGVHRNTLQNKVGNLGIVAGDYSARSSGRRRR